MTAILVLLLAMLLPIAASLGAVVIARRRRIRLGRRSPLSDKLFHGPGEQLRKQIDEHESEIQSSLLLLFLIGPLMLAGWGLSRIDWSWRIGLTMIGPAVVAVATACVAIRKLLRHEAARQRLREGMAAERMTAQQLAPLLAEGCLILHDIPAAANGTEFNLDHVIVGPHAVFVVETKSRKKPSTKGKESAQVAFDGEALRFPDHMSRRPIEQARALARWLREELRGAAGEPVPVVPVVALPGWYVNLTREGARSDVVVLNPKMHTVFLDQRHGPPLGQSLRNRVAHALVRRYPDTQERS